MIDVTRSPLPLFSSAAGAARAAVHRNDHHRARCCTAASRGTWISIRWSTPSPCSWAAASRTALAQAARLGQRWGYDEINLNCGCPSERVQRGAFGACLMAEPGLVADCVKAMRGRGGPSGYRQAPSGSGLRASRMPSCATSWASSTTPVAGCFIVACAQRGPEGTVAQGQPRDPPLRYEAAALLKRDFPDCVVVLNGGLADADAAVQAARTFDGVMLGRAASAHAAYPVRAVAALLASPVGCPAMRRWSTP